MTAPTAEDRKKSDVKRSKKWAKTHIFKQPVKADEFKKHKRLTPEARFEFLMNVLLEALEKPHKHYPKRGNIYAMDHTGLQEDAARYMQKTLSVATMFVYFRDKAVMMDCILIWANANVENPDPRTAALATRIAVQHASVYGA